jgi:cyclopropane fatty-acyl-phospholipid synthase-like methyltransferase
MISPSRITVSDIDRRAVDFVRKEFGVRGFYSVATAEDLVHADLYDAIVVVSLFSHLPMEQWGPWLKRLNSMLTLDGLLLFSTLGNHAYEVNVGERDRDAFQTKAEGFRYREQNETRGRLSSQEYGVAYVSEDYVRGVAAASFTDPVLEVVPGGLNGFQDVYLLKCSDEVMQ